MISIVLALVIAIVAMVVFLFGGLEGRSSARGNGKQQFFSTARSPETQASPSKARLKGDVLGRVVLSLAPTLTDDERRVMDEMARAGGEVLQSDLPKMTDFSKASVSKAIQSLEVRGIVVRERHKWTYWCKVNPRLVERTLQKDEPSKLSQATS